MTDVLLEEYMQAAIGTGSADPKRNNKCAAKLHLCYKTLHTTEEGRTGITRLISNDNPYVRGWAAAHSLQWVPETARPVLEALRDSDGPASFAAKWTLKEYDDGQLSFDY